MKKHILIMTTCILSAMGCENSHKSANSNENSDFNYSVDQFADVEVLRYKVSGFEELSLNQKKLIYFLSEAALEGRDILYDQNNKYNLSIRKTLESVYQHYKGNRNSANFKNLETYLKRVWFSNGIHHHYATDKFEPEFDQTFFEEAVRSIPASSLPVEAYENSVESLLNTIIPVMFDKKLYAKRVNQTPGQDLIMTSANNYYENVTEKEVDSFYNNLKNPTDSTPVSYGLNSKLMKENGIITEKQWKIDGMYSPAIKKIVYWLEKAKEVAENNQQKKAINTLIEYYKTGDLKTFDDYSILWVKDIDSRIDFINGFIETYGDPLGIKASWESIVNFKNLAATERTEIISNNAQWFEDNSPVDPRFKKENVKGVTAKVITVAMLGGDCFSPTPIGINLPNSNWIRETHGSKSVTIENITDAYDKAAKGNGFREEFVWSPVEIELLEKYGFVTGNIHTDLHECLGHGSGQLMPGVSQDALRAYGATIEEARADLFGLYYAADEKLVELGLLPDKEAYKAEYYNFMMNGLLTQLTRIEPGKDIEESHMRNRQLIAKWVLEKGKDEKVVELKKKEGKTYIVINDYKKMRDLLGTLLAEIQRIKSEGDYEAAHKLVEKYAVKVEAELHKEIKKRYEALHLAPYKGFVNPTYELITDKDNNIIDIQIKYGEGFADQMMRYAKEYSNLPPLN